MLCFTKEWLDFVYWQQEFVNVLNFNTINAVSPFRSVYLLDALNINEIYKINGIFCIHAQHMHMWISVFMYVQVFTMSANFKTGKYLYYLTMILESFASKIIFDNLNPFFLIRWLWSDKDLYFVQGSNQVSSPPTPHLKRKSLLSIKSSWYIKMLFNSEFSFQP